MVFSPSRRAAVMSCIFFSLAKLENIKRVIFHKSFTKYHSCNNVTTVDMIVKNVEYLIILPYDPIP